MSMLAGDIESSQDILHILREPIPALCFQNRRHAVKCLRDTAGDAGQCVAVATERSRCPDDILEIHSFQKCRDCFRNGLLTTLDMIIRRSNLIAGPRQVITELTNDVLPDIILAASCPGEEDGTRGCFRPFDSLRMVVRYPRCESGHMPGFLQRVKEPACRGHPHGRSVAVATIGMGIIAPEPVPEPASVSCMRIFSPPFSHGLDESLPDVLILPELAVQQSLRHGDCHDGIIGKVRLLAKQRKLLAFITSVKFVGCSDNVSKYCSVHLTFLLVRLMVSV